MRKSFFIMVLMCLVNFAQAQMIIVPREKLDAVNNPSLSENSTSFRFETVTITAEPMNEDDGVQTFTYPFENVGKAVLNINKFVTTCNCATASCGKMSISPGETSEIVVRYNPKGHPGRFERKIFVYVNGEQAPAAVLKLAVEVERGSDMTGLYPIAMGNLRVRRSDVQFQKGVAAVESCAFVNVGERALKLECEDALLPSCLTFMSEPQVVEPGEEGRILIEYDPSKGGERPRMPVMIKGLGVPPTQSSITVYVKEK